MVKGRDKRPMVWNGAVGFYWGGGVQSGESSQGERLDRPCDLKVGGGGWGSNTHIYILYNKIYKKYLFQAQLNKNYRIGMTFLNYVGFSYVSAKHLINIRKALKTNIFPFIL